MAHELIPKTGKPLLSIDEVTRRLKATFRHVELDAERASREIEEWIEWAQGARARGATAYTNEQIARARRAIGHSVFVVVADDTSAKNAHLDFTLQPEAETIFIGYESEEQEQASETLRERLAVALDYEMELV